MKYDDASWHYGGNFPKDLPIEAGATHTGMFVVWALLSGLGGDIHVTDFPDEIPKLHSRSITPGEFFLSTCDGKFTDEDLNEEGNAFAQAYFDFKKGNYLKDYNDTLGRDLKSLYYVKDTWGNYDLLKSQLDRRFADWKSKRRPGSN
jgi:hypothetical protein